MTETNKTTDRLVKPQETSEEAILEITLRPRELSNFVGQEQIKKT